jgi:hypothetical protein
VVKLTHAGRQKLPSFPCQLGNAYAPAPGIHDGEFEARVIAVRGQVAKLYFRYKDGTENSLFVSKSREGEFRDLDYDLPCGLSLTSAPFALRGD